MPYEKMNTNPPISRAIDLPNLTEGILAEYHAGAGFNSKEGSLKFHMHFRTSILLHKLKISAKSIKLHSGKI